MIPKRDTEHRFNGLTVINKPFNSQHKTKQEAGGHILAIDARQI